MPTKPKASAPASEPIGDATETKPKTPRRRANTKRKAAPTKPATTRAAATKARKPKSTVAAARSKAAVAKLQSAIAKLEAALEDSPRAEAAIPTPPTAPIEAVSTDTSAPISPPLPPRPLMPPIPPAPTEPRPEIEVEPSAWSRAAGPAMATAAFLVFVATLVVGYSTGYAVGTDSVDDPMVLTASASERPAAVKPATIKPAPPQPKPVVAEQEPSPMAESAPKAAPKPAPVLNGGGLHLQVSALKSREAATQLSERLENEGYPVKVREPEADGLVRVLVGPVNDSDQLTAMANRLREEGLKPFPKRL